MDAASLINQLKCEVCANHLSYFPICVTKDKNICGRCPCEDGAIRIAAYETAVAFHKFPCRYEKKGCLEELLPKNVPKHEQNCAFRFEQCPVLECNWEGILTDVISHCEEKHPERILKDLEPFGIDLTSSLRIPNLFVHDNQLLIVFWDIDTEEKELHCQIINHRNAAKKYLFKLILRSEGGNNVATFYTYKKIEVSYVSVLSESLKVSKITGYLSLDKSSKTISKVRNQQRMAAAFKCGKCSVYVFPPIHTNSDGAVCCRRCFKGTTFKAVLNSTLTNLAELVLYPCKNEELGCKFTAISSSMKIHKKLCQFNVVECGFGTQFKPCHWKDQLHRLDSHIEQSHLFVPNGVVLGCELSKDLAKFRKLVKFEDRFFELVHFCYSEHFYCFVKKNRGRSEVFKYEIKFIDVIDNNADRLTIRKNCANYERKLDYKNIDSKTVCCVPKKQIATFASIPGKTDFCQCRVRIFV